tara:strand:- start:2805 stop:2969 length:165 start_codon:yes stop_codon:yes gene_type:complete
MIDQQPHVPYMKYLEAEVKNLTSINQGLKEILTLGFISGCLLGAGIVGMLWATW